MTLPPSASSTSSLFGQLRAFVERLRFTFALIEEGSNISLIELPREKKLAFQKGDIASLEQARAPQTGSSYLRIQLADGRRLALASMGFVFAPSFASTGEVADCPPTASFADFEKLFRHLAHLVEDHHEGHEQEALQVFMVLLAFLDGARAIGLDVGPEERKLEPISIVSRPEQDKNPPFLASRPSGPTHKTRWASTSVDSAQSDYCLLIA